MPGIITLNEFEVAKPFYQEKQARKEFEMGRFLFLEGIRVPEFYDIISPCEKTNYDYWILMQRINGKFIGLLSRNEQFSAETQFRSEIKRVLNLGLYPLDCDFILNSLYSNGISYLIDLSDWRTGSDLELESVRQWIARTPLRLRIKGIISERESMWFLE